MVKKSRPSRARINPVYSTRYMKTYSITEFELNHINSYDRRAIIYYAAATFFSSVDFSFLWMWNDFSIFVKVIFIGMLVIASGMGYLGYSEGKNKQASIDLIKNESELPEEGKEKEPIPLE